jgi:hypothetical protein
LLHQLGISRQSRQYHISFESRKTANEEPAVLYGDYNTHTVKKSRPSEWHYIFEELRVKVIDIERSSRLEFHKSNENVKKVADCFCRY